MTGLEEVNLSKIKNMYQGVVKTNVRNFPESVLLDEGLSASEGLNYSANFY